MSKTTDSYRVGRNFIRVGDAVKAKPFGRKTFGLAKVTRIDIDDQGEVVGVEVKDERSTSVRTVTPDRIKRIALTKSGAKREVLR